MPRLPYPTEGALDPRSAQVLDQLPVRINLFNMLGNVPSLIGPVLRLGGAILGRMELAPAWRELAILRVAARSGTEYEWHHHEPMARQAGLPPHVIDAARRLDPDASAAAPDGVARLILVLVDQTLVDGSASAEVVADLDAAVGTTQVLELICTVGYYSMIGQLLRSVDVEIDDRSAPSGTLDPVAGDRGGEERR